MEHIVAIFTLIVIIVHFINQSLPSSKFEKAKRLFVAGDYAQASNILNKIFEKHVDAPAKFAECKLKLGLQTLNKSAKLRFFNEVVEIRKRINNPLSIPNFDVVEAKAFFEIAKIQYEETKGDIEKLNQNIRFIDTVNQKGSESDFSTLKTNHFNDLADSHFKIAAENEKSHKYTEAIQSYERAKEYAKTANNTNKVHECIKNVVNCNSLIHFEKAISLEKLHEYTEAIQSYKLSIDYAKQIDNNVVLNNSTTRIAICQLKNNENIDVDGISKIQESDKSYQKDLYYRYIIHLLESNRYLKAEMEISKYPNFQSPDIDKLKEIIKANDNNNAINNINSINDSINNLYNNVLSLNELESFYRGLDGVSNQISSLDNQLSERILAIKPTLFNRLLTNYISDEQYEKAINIIQDYPQFWETPELLKNFGISCYGCVSKGLLTESNYRAVVSGWLTSVFSGRVILNSLEQTIWDDNYTFTLLEAIGANEYIRYQGIPVNVNYFQVSQTNISIGKTQKELLQHFETIIQRGIQDADLSKAVNNFYDSEKEAIEKVIKIIKNDIFFATPYFVKSKGINNKIIEELDNNYNNYSDESVLEAGIPYIKNSNSSFVFQYSYTKDLVEKVVEAINNENFNAIKRLNTNENKQKIENFVGLRDSVEDKLFGAISRKISVDKKNERLIPIMEECILFSGRNERLKNQYSNYVSYYCVSKVENQSMNYFEALTLMKEAYIHSPNNHRVVMNFITLIRFNLLDIFYGGANKMTEIYTILDWVKNNMSKTYRQNSNKLSIERLKVLQESEDAGYDISILEDKNPFSDLLLDSQGLRIKKVLIYLNELEN